MTDSLPLLSKSEPSGVRHARLWPRCTKWWTTPTLVAMTAGVFVLLCTAAILLTVFLGLYSGTSLPLPPGLYVAVTADSLPDIDVYNGTSGHQVGHMFGDRHLVLNPRGLILRPDGSILISQSTTKSPAILLGNSPCNPISVTSIASGTFSGALHHPYGLTVALDGHLYVTNQDNNAITRYALPSGDLVPPVPFFGGSPTTLDTPRGIAASNLAFTVIVAARDGNALLEISTSTQQVVRTFTIPSPIGVFVTPGSLLISGSSADSLLRIWDLQSATLLSTFGNATTLQHPAGMGMLDSETLLVISQAAQSITQWNISDPTHPVDLGHFVKNVPKSPEQMLVFVC